mmetsp:Transcript_25023/g.39315  ORF Transcript_25023/g.39315 Transcript_25023/m.39315 type:complete len:339 (+) Transcript_25023:76-1092(+)|eukprot:CAMPEP_0201727022 /NCGR_PEP_ID=MMETSP0593-20130828/10585_1 /ASSEMBLY_ACC=CAM_ASM_000672 /TAXON_ID=267983 /ORGANISM="Skeletonema japonicum, Strain CCMP2506" /LENGTH=338 /DNA_ID=CAMNT_0048218631 /DNA_START=43 /DNA_END=1059 /DNA_ORIENTATION=+
MKLSTTFISALLATSTSTFLEAVSANDNCNSITDASGSWKKVDNVLRNVPYLDKASAWIDSTFELVKDFGGCPSDLLTADDVIDIAKCVNRNISLATLTDEVENLNLEIGTNNQPKPFELKAFATAAGVIEATCVSVGFQAALLTTELAVTKHGMKTSEYLSREESGEDSGDVNEAKGQAVAGIEQSLKQMKRLENDLESILDNGRYRQETTDRGECIDDEWEDCGFIDQPGCLELKCVMYKWDVKISYWCNTETYTYRTEAKNRPSRQVINARIQDTKEKIRNKFFPSQYHSIKDKLKAGRDSLCKELKEVNFKFESGFVICKGKEKKKNKPFDAEL